MNNTCLICGADLLHGNLNFCKNFHNQTKVRESHERHLNDIRKKDNAIRNKTLDKAIDAITAQLNNTDRNWKGMQKAIEIVSGLKGEYA